MKEFIKKNLNNPMALMDKFINAEYTTVMRGNHKFTLSLQVFEKPGDWFSAGWTIKKEDDDYIIFEVVFDNVEVTYHLRTEEYNEIIADAINGFYYDWFADLISNCSDLQKDINLEIEEGK